MNINILYARIRVIVLWVLALALSASFAAAQECTRHTEAAGGFSVCLPGGWTAEGSSDSKFKTLFAPSQPGQVRANINFRDDSRDISLSEYVDASVKYMFEHPEQLEGVSELKVASRQSLTTDLGLAYVRVAFHSVFKGFVLRTVQYYFSLGSSKLIVTGTELEKDQSTFDPLFDRAAKSFKWEK
jgi:hypothetical protein